MATARYLRAACGDHSVHITYIGGCPSAEDPSIDERLTPDAFLADLADTDGNSEGAYQEYEAAHRLQPEAQSAWIALIRSASMTGRTTRERELIEQYATRTKMVEDPWWYFSMGFDTELVTWLHAVVTTP